MHFDVIVAFSSETVALVDASGDFYGALSVARCID